VSRATLAPAATPSLAHLLLYRPGDIPGAGCEPDVPRWQAAVEAAAGYPMNLEQAAAFRRVFDSRLSLLWGPPGTGKTAVSAGIVLGWLERAAARGQGLCVGVASSNWAAMDHLMGEITSLLARRGGSPLDVSLSRVRGDFAEEYEHPVVRDFPQGGPEAQSLAEEATAGQGLHVVSGTWAQLSRLARRLDAGEEPRAAWFDLLIVDEASQVPTLTAAAYYLLLKPGAHVLLAGDPAQLGPIYPFAADTPEPLLDCAFAHSRSQGAPLVTLLENYRSHEAIVAWPRSRFYPGYRSHRPGRNLGANLLDLLPPSGPPPGWPAALPWSDGYRTLLDPGLPVCLVSYPAGSATLANPAEAQVAAALAMLFRMGMEARGDFNGEEDFWRQRCGIVTPHRAQVSRIRNHLLGECGFASRPEPAVATVDRFQGQERDLVIASYSVSDPDYVAMEAEFLLDPRRFNVTLTRARSKFVMLASEAVLEHLAADPDVALRATHLQLFAESYLPEHAHLDLPGTGPWTLRTPRRTD
jgi:hypothetical protein